MKNLLVILLLLMSSISGCIFFKEMYRSGFDESDLTIPDAQMANSNLMERPDANLWISPIFRYNILCEMGKVYTGYGGITKISVENTGKNDLFLYNFGIEIDGKEWNWLPGMDRGVEIEAGNEYTFDLSFGCPETPRNYSYKMAAYLMVKRIGWHGKGWYEIGKKYLEPEDKIQVRSLSEKRSYKLQKNYYQYFDKINELIDFDQTVYETATEIAWGFSGKYNILQVCAIYDFMKKLEYIKEPEGEDVWIDPCTTLDRNGGDCEDYAILFAAMINSIGGTARIYLTDNHAFATVYIGNDESMNDILKGVESYYGTNLFFALIEDDFGYWLVSDPLASLYMGGLPAGGGPVSISSNNIYNRDFVDTKHVNAIDVMKD